MTKTHYVSVTAPVEVQSFWANHWRAMLIIVMVGVSFAIGRASEHLKRIADAQEKMVVAVECTPTPALPETP